jgi:uncharacterized protein
MLTRQEELEWWSRYSMITVEDAGLSGCLLLKDELLQGDHASNIPQLSFEGLSEHLRQMGITSGIDLVTCQQVVMFPRNYIGSKVKVALGKEPVNGENATIEILIDFDQEHGPEVLEDGRVDYYNLGIVRTVRGGQLLARKTLATEGVPGTAVNGTVLIAKPGRDVRLPQGKHTVISEDGLELIAELDGHVSYNPMEGKISVFDVFEVKADVDFAVGNIEFLGNVRIRGNVQPGFRVVAAGDIEVVGYVDGAVLEAGGDILIRGGVQMRSKGMIQAAGTVRSRFLQGATVEAGVDVITRDSIMHCNVSAGRHVFMEAQKSVIVGGVVRAGEEVRTRTLGSPMATPTEIEVGVHPQLRKEMSELHTRLKELMQNMDKTKKALALLDNMAGIGNQLPPDKAALRQNLSHTYEHYQQEEEELMYRRSEIEAILLDTRQAKVFITDVCYAGVKLTLGQQVTYIRDPHRGPVRYEIQDAEIVGTHF